VLLTHVQRTCCECVPADRVLNEILARLALFWRVPDVFAACGSAEETPQKMDDPDEMRVYSTKSLFCDISRTSWNELALHEIRVIRRRRRRQRKYWVRPWIDRRRQFGLYDQLRVELRNEDQPASLQELHEDTPEMFHELLTRVGPTISKRRPPTLA